MTSTIVPIHPPLTRAQELCTVVCTAAYGAESEKGKAFMAQARSLLSGPSPSFPPAIKHALNSLSDAFASSHPDHVMEGICVIVFSFFGAVSEDEGREVTQWLTAALAADPAVRSKLRLQILGSLYNVLDTAPKSKFGVFEAMVDYAAASKQLDVVRPFLDKSDSWETVVGFTSDQVKSILLRVSDAYDAVGDGDAAQSFLIKFLKCFETASAADLSAVKPQAKRATIGYIKAPAVSQQSNLIDLRAVQQLASDPEDSLLFNLLHIFSYERLQQYEEFYAANKAYVDAIGLDHEQSRRTMRLLSLCSLASDGEIVSYDAIQETLEVEAEDVERWLVDAISLGLINGRMDQVGRQMLVSKWTQRTFGPDEWKMLQAKLGGWEARMQALVDNIAVARHTSK